MKKLPLSFDETILLLIQNVIPISLPICRLAACLTLVWFIAACSAKETQAVLPEGCAIGPTDQCHATPQFLSTLNFERPVIDTTQEFAVGVLVRDLAGDRTDYQHDTWDDAGKVGPFAIDWLGNIFVAPTPVISLELNPVAEQNKIFKVDTRTGEMGEFISLPWPLPPGSGNPYGVVGLAYDCDTGSLYAASIAGSTPQDEVGVIYQIDPTSGEILSKLENVDALGIGIFRASQGRRLYYGAGRTPEIYSVLLAGDGRFSGQPRLEFSLAAQPGGSTDKAQRLQFTADNSLIVKAIEFNYSLQPTSHIQKDVYTFQYQPADDAWTLLDITEE
ncbi:MAG: hypothetical protein BroJett015_05670 [Chloroflexota bacterium]|nr:hypothetical protein [Ardenticatenaceae bacterium]GIK54904.1 MAG: hypothetical protein BroJett015_05670 [Chloroflexota bacterium]